MTSLITDKHCVFMESVCSNRSYNQCIFVRRAFPEINDVCSRNRFFPEVSIVYITKEFILGQESY